MGFVNARNDLDVERTLTTLILTNDDLPKTVELLKQQGYTTTEGVVESLRYQYRDRLVVRRKEMAPKLEAELADDLLDSARLVAKVERLAVERTEQLLKEGKVQDPSRVARDLSQVRTQAIDKRLALEGRPDKIIEKRDHREIIRGLEALKVAEVVDSTATEEPAEISSAP